MEGKFSQLAQEKPYIIRLTENDRIAKSGDVMELMSCLTRSQGKQLIIGGHRGHQSDIRENTIRNFSQVIGKVPYIEIDVQLTKDDQLVIFHDSRLEWTTELYGEIRDYTLAELRESFEIDTVIDTIAWCSKNQLGVAFELKIPGSYSIESRRLLAQKLCQYIKLYDFYSECFVFGKDYDTLGLIREIDELINIGIIAPPKKDDVIPLMKKIGSFMYLDFLKDISKNLIKELHDAGYLVDGSVVNSEDEIRKAVQLGVDMIESDYPEIMIELYETIK